MMAVFRSETYPYGFSKDVDEIVRHLLVNCNVPITSRYASELYHAFADHVYGAYWICVDENSLGEFTHWLGVKNNEVSDYETAV